MSTFRPKPSVATSARASAPERRTLTILSDDADFSQMVSGAARWYYHWEVLCHSAITRTDLDAIAGTAIVIVHLCSPDRTYALASSIRQYYPHLPIALVIKDSMIHRYFSTLSLGAVQVFREDEPPAELLAELDRWIWLHSALYDSENHRRYSSHFQPVDFKEGPNTEPVAERGALFDKITPREHEILLEVSTGASNKEIAKKLFLSEGTVKNYVARLLRRFNARSRVRLITLAGLSKS